MKLLASLVLGLTQLVGSNAPAPAADQSTPPPAKPMTVSASRLENAVVHAPDGVPTALVVYLSDKSGWQPSDDKIVEALRADGNVVLSVDFSRYAAKLDADTGECLYVVGELTDLSQTAERQLGLQTYLPPIIVGSGEGATFAYAALADAPANTLGGAVGLGFANKLEPEAAVLPRLQGDEGRRRRIHLRLRRDLAGSSAAVRRCRIRR